VRFYSHTHYYACPTGIRAPYITPQTYTLFHRSTLQAFYTADKTNVKLYIQNHTLCVEHKSAQFAGTRGRLMQAGKQGFTRDK
jgi:hypothetical protein